MAAMTENAIKLTDISGELTRLWNEELGQKKIRASLFNLILYVQNTDRIPYYQNLIKYVVGKFPSRVMLIVNNASGEKEYLQTSVSSETIGEGEQKIYCEIIKIEVAGQLIERVPFLILPQILPDLPVYLLWTQDPATENDILPYLERFADRIIFDPRSTENLQNYAEAALTLMKRFHCAIGDLNWSLLSGWRRVFAQAFNDPESFLRLAQSSRIRVNYNRPVDSAQQHTEIEAAYFQAWLASRLNWKFQAIENHEGNIRLTYRRPMAEVVVLLTPKDVEKQPLGSIQSIDIESARNKAEYTFKKHPENDQVYIQYSDREFCQLPYTSFLGSSASGQEIVEEIFYPSVGKHYKEMLELLSLTPWKKREE